MEKFFKEINDSDTGINISGIENAQIPGNVTIIIAGNIEIFNADLFHDSIIELLEEKKEVKTIVMDLLQVNYVSSTGIGAIIRLIKYSKEQKIDILFLNVNDKIRTVITILGFSQFINIIDNGEIKRFPMVLQCPGCSKSITIKSTGETSCPWCKKAFTLDDYGVVS